jgi:deoxycytidine triphosphate deaminase
VSEHPWKYEDPNKAPSRKGLLLSNEIEHFCGVGLLIEKEGYRPEMVRPASYTLTIGPEYVDSEGRVRKMKDNDDYFYMEPNSIVYESTAEKLNLPFYIAARFNLRVKWVYRGILLGTGPQVDPGFKGNLSCPLFNLTDGSIKIRLGDQFATIDFERTSDFCANEPWDKIKNTLKVGEEQDEVFAKGQRYYIFKQKSFAPLKQLPDHDVISSLVQLSQEVRTWRNIGIAAVVAFLSLTLTLLNFQNNLYRDNRALTDQVTTLRERITKLEAKTPGEVSNQTDKPAGSNPLLSPPSPAPSKTEKLKDGNS